MTTKGTAFDQAREIALALPDVRDGSTPRGFALKLKGKMLACEAINKSAEPETLMVTVGFDERERLLAADAEAYYLTDHYVKHPVLLVRLHRIDRAALGNVLHSAWRYRMERL